MLCVGACGVVSTEPAGHEPPPSCPSTAFPQPDGVVVRFTGTQSTCLLQAAPAVWVSSNCAGWCVQGCVTAPCCLAPCRGSCPLPWQKQRVLHAPLQKPGAGCLCPYQGWCKWLHQLVLGVFSNLDDSKTHLRLQPMRAFCTAKPIAYVAALSCAFPLVVLRSPARPRGPTLS